MTATNDYLPFATGAGASVLSPATYASLTARFTGFQNGIADPAQANTAWRQSSMVAAMITQFISDTLSLSIVDDGNLASLENNFRAALASYLPSPSQSSLWHDGLASGTASAITVPTITPPLTSLVDGTPLLIQMPFANAANATVQLETFGAIPLLRNDGTPIQAGDAPSGSGMLAKVSDGATTLRLIGFGRAEVQRRIANPLIYIRTDGNDANDGSANDAGHAFATLQAAANFVTSNFVTTSQVITLQLGDPGTYALPSYISAGTFSIQGDLANQANYVLSGAGASGLSQITFISGANVQFSGVTLRNAGSTSSTIETSAGGVASFTNTTFTATASGNTGAHVVSGPGGTVEFGGGCIFSGSMGYMWLASGGNIGMGDVVLTVQGNPTFSATTVLAAFGGQIQIVVGASISGSATGQRYSIIQNGIINTSGGGANFFPGSIAGTQTTGGQYA